MAIDFSQLGNYQDYFNRIKGNTGPNGWVWNDQNTSSKLNQMGQTFNSLFESLVGRAPNSDELNQIYGTVLPEVLNSSGGLQFTTSQQLGDFTKNYIGDNFQKAAEQESVNQLQQQQTQATDLSNLFRKQGETTANTLETQLSDFVQRTFEKIRPNLITSLQSQGLLNTGAMDMAMAGKAKDLTQAAKDQVFDYRLGNEQQANAIQFGGASAPYEYQKALTMNRPDMLLQQAQGGLGRMFQTAQQQQAFAQQVALMNHQAKLQREAQPGFLKTMGQNFAGTFGKLGGQAAAMGMNNALFGGMGQGSGMNKAQSGMSPNDLAAMGIA